MTDEELTRVEQALATGYYSYTKDAPTDIRVLCADLRQLRDDLAARVTALETLWTVTFGTRDPEEMAAGLEEVRDAFASAGGDGK
jgi:hypothetical protein